jgi:hypothetical protein
MRTKCAETKGPFGIFLKCLFYIRYFFIVRMKILLSVKGKSTKPMIFLFLQLGKSVKISHLSCWSTFIQQLFGYYYKTSFHETSFHEMSFHETSFHITSFSTKRPFDKTSIATKHPWIQNVLYKTSNLQNVHRYKTSIDTKRP